MSGLSGLGLTSLVHVNGKPAIVKQLITNNTPGSAKLLFPDGSHATLCVSNIDQYEPGS